MFKTTLDNIPETVQVFGRTKHNTFINNKIQAQTTTSHTVSGLTWCKDGDFHNVTELQAVNFKEKIKLIWCILYICVISVTLLAYITLQQKSDLYITKKNVALLSQQLKTLAETCGKLNHNILQVRLMADELDKRDYYRNRLNLPDDNINNSKNEITGVPSEMDESFASNTNFISSSFVMDINENDNQLIPERIKVKNNVNGEFTSGTSIESEIKINKMLYKKLSEINKTNPYFESLPITVTMNSSDMLSQKSNRYILKITTLPTLNSSDETVEDNAKKGVLKFEDTDLKHSREEDTRTGRREKRSNKRGNQSGMKSHRDHLGRQRKKAKIRGPVAAHFKGGQPETFIQDGGSLVAPWFPDERASGDFALSAFQLREGKGTVEVTASGLYLIYAQVYYLTSDTLNSFSINVREAGDLVTPIAYCSVNAFLSTNGSVTEVSCFTSVVRFLNATNQVFLKQRDRNRRMILRDGHSFLGIIKLNGHTQKSRREG